MRYGNTVKGVRSIGDYKLRVVFSDGYIGDIDLWPLFANPRGPIKEPFKDPEFFKKVYLDVDVVAWPNGYDICSDVLRYYCEQGRVTSQEEMNAYFNPQTSEMVLKDQSPRK